MFETKWCNVAWDLETWLDTVPPLELEPDQQRGQHKSKLVHFGSNSIQISAVFPIQMYVHCVRVFMCVCVIIRGDEGGRSFKLAIQLDCLEIQLRNPICGLFVWARILCKSLTTAKLLTPQFCYCNAWAQIMIT